MSDPVFTFDDGYGFVVNVYAEEVDGGVKFTVETVSGVGDINGFFLDLGSDGGAIKSVGSNANNMNGAYQSGFDYAVELGSVGGSDANYTDGCFTIKGITLAQLEGATAGIRATGVTGNPAGSVKLVDQYDPPPEPGDHFPEWPQDISNIVLYFDAADVGDNLDTRPSGGDGFVLVKIDDVPDSAPNDLDDWLGDVLAYLQANLDPDLTIDNLLGVAIKGGTQSTKFYAVAGDGNGPAPDPFPAGAPDPVYPPPQGQVPGPEIDYSFNYDQIFP